MATVDLGYSSSEAMPYGRISASDAFLRRRMITGWIVRGILFLAAALSVLITASIVYILVYEFDSVFQASFDHRFSDGYRMDAGF